MLCWAWTLGAGALGRCPRPLRAAVAPERSHKPGVTQREPPERALVRGQRPFGVRRFQYMALRTEPAKAIYAFVQEEILQQWDFYFLIFIYYF